MSQATPAAPFAALKQHKKNPFLEAYVCRGDISSAARSVGISRFSVHNWLHKDPAFARAFENAMNMVPVIKGEVHVRIKELLSQLGARPGKVSLDSSAKTYDCASIGSRTPVEASACRV